MLLPSITRLKNKLSTEEKQIQRDFAYAKWLIAYKPTFDQLLAMGNRAANQLTLEWSIPDNMRTEYAVYIDARQEAVAALNSQHGLLRQAVEIYQNAANPKNFSNAHNALFVRAMHRAEHATREIVFAALTVTGVSMNEEFSEPARLAYDLATYPLDIMTRPPKGLFNPNVRRYLSEIKALRYPKNG